MKKVSNKKGRDAAAAETERLQRQQQLKTNGADKDDSTAHKNLLADEDGDDVIF